MKQVRCVTRILMVAVAGLLITGSARSAPTVPRPPAMTAEARSLAGIRQLRLHVQPLPETLQKTGLTAENIHEGWRENLLKNGFEIADDEELPQLSLELVATRDEDIPNGLALAAMIRLRQGVTVNRLSQSMHLTTYLDHILILETDQQAAPLLDKVLAVMVDRFMTKVRLADRDAQ